MNHPKFQQWLFFTCLILSCGFFFCEKDPVNPEPDIKPFVIENLGVTFGAWEPETNMAGDFYFNPHFQKIFSEFGARVRDPEGNIKELPTFDYVIRNDAFVFSISEGEVIRIDYQENTQDYEFSIRSLNDPAFEVIYDHFVNLRIKLGDPVQPGDTLGNGRPWNSEIGGLEIMINNSKTKLSYCPFCCFNPDKLEEYQQKIRQLILDWEAYKGDSTIYDEENHVMAGCRYESMLSY